MSSASAEDHRWLTAAVEVSRQCTPTPTNFAVGAVVVDHGSLLATGYTGEIHPRDHAEEVALAKLAGDLSRSTVYSSLEPCTMRQSRPGTCTDLILAAGIRRVVIAWREPLLFADCHGVEVLRGHGVEVIEISALAPLVRRINAHVLDQRPADRR